MKNYNILIFLLLALKLTAQQDPHYSLYLFNQLPYNPATTADREVTTLNLQYRNQWLKLDGAPKTTHLNAQLPFSGGRNGLGIALTADRLGMTGTNSLALSYAYRFKLSGSTKLGLGLQASLDQFRIAWDKAKPLDAGDQDIPAAAASETGANFGLGAQLSGKRYYLGVGIPKLLPTKLYDDEYITDNGAGIVRTIYMMAGITFPLGSKVDLIPGAMLALNKHHPSEFDLSVQALFQKKFGLGLNLRADDSIDAFLMYKITSGLRAGFAWDFTTSKLRQLNNGSFELMLGYQFGKEKAPEKCRTFEDVRFF